MANADLACDHRDAEANRGYLRRAGRFAGGYSSRRN